MRKSIFEIVEDEIDLDFEIEIIMTLYDESKLYGYYINYSLEEYFDFECIYHWKARRHVTSGEQMRKLLGITDEDVKGGLDAKKVLVLLEYIVNVIFVCDVNTKTKIDEEWSKEFKMLKENVKNLLCNLNYEIIKNEEEQKAILVEKCAAATATAEIIEGEASFAVIEYNHYLLKGDLARKKQILKILADKFEGKKKQIKSINKNLVNEIGCLINKLNIRHNNVEGENAETFTQQLSPEEMEEWYDDTYQLLLLAFLEEDNMKRRDKVRNLMSQL